MANGISDFMEEWKGKFDEFDKKIELSRRISRSALFRLIFLSASVVGFSVSLFSIPALQSSLDMKILRYSWYLFVGVIILGFFILIWEGRIKYGKTWKGFQVSQFPDTPNYSFKEKFYAFLIVIISLFYPANLLFNRIYKDEAEKKFKERVNGLVVQKLAEIEHLLIFFENIVFILFTCGIILLVLSFVK